MKKQLPGPYDYVKDEMDLIEPLAGESVSSFYKRILNDHYSFIRLSAARSKLLKTFPHIRKTDGTVYQAAKSFKSLLEWRDNYMASSDDMLVVDDKLISFTTFDDLVRFKLTYDGLR